MNIWQLAIMVDLLPRLTVSGLRLLRDRVDAELRNREAAAPAKATVAPERNATAVITAFP